MPRSPRRESLNKVSPEEWRRRIDGITDFDIRVKVAHLVWWEFFSQAVTEDYNAHLDDLMRETIFYTEPSDEETMAGLMEIGYPEEKARSKARTPEVKNRPMAYKRNPYERRYGSVDLKETA